MRRTDVKFKGMTLIEVIIAMTVIILVTIIAYMGVSTSANYIQKGTDLRASDGGAVKSIEDAIVTYMNSGSDSKTTVKYDVVVKTKQTEAYNKTVVVTGGGTTSESYVTDYRVVTDGNREAVIAGTRVVDSLSADVCVVTGGTDRIEYEIVLPYITAAPVNPGE